MKKILFICLFLFNAKLLYADIPHFIDFKYILNESNAGKGAQNTLKTKLENGLKSLKEKEKKIKKDEQKIIQQKKLISAEEYKKKVKELRKQVSSLQKE